MPEEKNEGTISIPDDADEESRKIADELEKEGKAKPEKVEDKPPKEPDKKAEKEPEKEEEEAGEEGKEEKKDEEEEELPARTPRQMPIYKHKIAEKRWQQEKEKLEADIEELKGQVQKRPSADREKKIKELAEKSGLESEFISGLLELSEGGETQELRKEIGTLRSQIETTRKENEQSRQDRLFDKDFEKNINPLLEEEDIPQEKQKEIKKLLKDLAFTEEYVGKDGKNPVPLKVIYRGEEQFDDFRKKGKKSAESSGKAPHAGEGEEKDWSEMTDEEFEKDSEEKAKPFSRYKILDREGKEVK